MKLTCKTVFRQGQGAFTLIELMVVVAIIGLLASVSMPMFTKYIRKSKTTEAYSNLRKIYDGEVIYFQEEHVDSNGSVLPRRFVETVGAPSWPPGRNKKEGLFSEGNWPLINFIPDGPVLYIYFADAFPFVSPYPARPAFADVTADPPTGIAVGMMVNAVGDIDGDGEFSLFQRSYGVTTDGVEKPMGGIFALDRLE